MKVAIYSRVSTDEQDANKQEKELLLFAQRHNYEVYNTYLDVISGTKDSRPNLNRMIQDAYNKEFEAVICWKLDRLGRSLTHLIDIVNKLKNWGVGLIFTTQQIDTTTPQGKLFFHIFGAFAEFEREMISERTKLGLKNAKNVGKRGKDSKPRKWRSDKGLKRGGYKIADLLINKEAN
jgi:DNA invertase Pin-like site-specific DNA recombinase